MSGKHSSGLWLATFLATALLPGSALAEPCVQYGGSRTCGSNQGGSIASVNKMTEEEKEAERKRKKENAAHKLLVEQNKRKVRALEAQRKYEDSNEFRALVLDEAAVAAEDAGNPDRALGLYRQALA